MCAWAQQLRLARSLKTRSDGSLPAPRWHGPRTATQAGPRTESEGPAGHAPLQPAPICSLLKETPRVLAKICPAETCPPESPLHPSRELRGWELGSAWRPSEGLTSATYQVGKLRLSEE